MACAAALIAAWTYRQGGFFFEVLIDKKHMDRFWGSSAAYAAARRAGELAAPGDSSWELPPEMRAALAGSHKVCLWLQLEETHGEGQ